MIPGRWNEGIDHLAVGALDRQEPVLQVAGVVILVHADGVGVAGLHQARIPGEHAAIVTEIAVGGVRPHAGAVEGAEPAAIEDEPVRRRPGAAPGSLAMSRGRSGAAAVGLSSAVVASIGVTRKTWKPLPLKAVVVSPVW